MLRFIVLIFGFSLGSATFGQMTPSDSLKLANDQLNMSILHYLNWYESQNNDYIILRVKDTTTHTNNYCTFLVNRDSCTTKFRLSIAEDFSIHTISISEIDYYGATWPCPKSFFKIAANLKDNEGLFVENVKPIPDLDSTAILFYGKWNENYFVQNYDSDVDGSIQSVVLYQVICNHFLYPCRF